MQLPRYWKIKFLALFLTGNSLHIKIKLLSHLKSLFCYRFAVLFLRLNFSCFLDFEK